MELNELCKLIDIEIQWLHYYAHVESREQLNESSDIYNDLVSIGYTKRVMPLEMRCCPCVITSDEIITEGLDLSKLQKDKNLRGDNRLSPLEAYIKLFPDKKMIMLNRLK